MTDTAARVIGLDIDTADTRAADRLLHRLAARLPLPAGALACTHRLRVPEPRLGLSLELPDARWAAAVWDRLAAPDLREELRGAGGGGSTAVLGDRLLTVAPTAPEGRGGSEEVPGNDDGTDEGAGAAGARAARTAAAAPRADGVRAVVFPGSAGVPDTLPVGELLRTTAIERAEVLGGLVPEAGAPVETAGHLRPEWRDGALLLRLVPVVGGRYMPFDVPDPHPCCADHA
ncbi:hypothetical protein GCM10027160_52000 [Streptomyces calidiresistens]|uniref:Uncharacterized protein n=1 Tax=Streptomyces calidiresistens TaxID=1485586 RepID=A0A7W3T5X3_9ACTN|nr:hypothetical protein [Streptomyces calidiresistens]MBB0231529.1 hypothetical protein [Streptomyces calidiresistens]